MSPFRPLFRFYFFLRGCTNTVFEKLFFRDNIRLGPNFQFAHKILDCSLSFSHKIFSFLKKESLDRGLNNPFFVGEIKRIPFPKQHTKRDN